MLRKWRGARQSGVKICMAWVPRQLTSGWSHCPMGRTPSQATSQCSEGASCLKGAWASQSTHLSTPHSKEEDKRAWENPESPFPPRPRTSLRNEHDLTAWPEHDLTAWMSWPQVLSCKKDGKDLRIIRTHSSSKRQLFSLLTSLRSSFPLQLASRGATLAFSLLFHERLPPPEVTAPNGRNTGTLRKGCGTRSTDLSLSPWLHVIPGGY